MKVLFLDFDGCLNSSEWAGENHRQRELAASRGESDEIYQWPFGHLSPILVCKLNTICEATDCKIVISSTWRHHEPFYDLADWLMIKGFKYPERIIDRTENLYLGYGRGYEIQEWLNNNAVNVSAFVIVDDDWDMHHLMPYLVNPDAMVGLSDDDVKNAIAMLNGEIETIPNHQKRSELAAYMTDVVWGEEPRYGISL